MTPRKRISLVLGSVSVLLVSLVVAGILFLQSSFFQGFLLKQINQNIPGHLSWKSLSVSFFWSTINIKDITIQGQDEKTIIHIPKLSMNLSLKKLFSKEIYFSSVLAESATLNLQLSEQGQLNLVSAIFDPSLHDTEKPEALDASSTLPYNLMIQKIIFKNGAVNLKAAEKGLDVLVSGVDFTLDDLDLLKQSAHIELGIQKGLIHQKNVSLVLPPSFVKVDIKKDQMSHIMVHTALNGVDIEIYGNAADVFTTLNLDMIIKATVDFKTAKRTFKNITFPSGTATAELIVKGHPGNPDANLSISYGPGTFYDQPIDSLMIKSILKDQVLTILPSKIESGSGKVSFEGLLDLKAAFPEGFLGKKQDIDEVLFQFNISQDGMDLSSVLSKVFSKTYSKAGGQKGRLSSKISLNGKGVYPLKMKTEIDIHAEGINISGKGNLNMPGFDLSSLNISEGKLSIEAQNLSLLKNLTGVKAQGGVTMAADISGNMKTHIVNAVIEGKEIALEKVQIGNVTAKINFFNRILNIKHAKIQNKRSRLDIHGKLLLFMPDTFEMKHSPDMDLAFDGQTIFLDDFFENMKGKISFKGQLKGNTEHLAGSLGIAGKNLEINGQKLEQVSAAADIKDQVIDINAMDILVTKGSKLSTSGKLQLSDKTLDLHMISKDFDLTCLDFVQRKEIQSAKLSLDAIIKGRIDNPSLEGNVYVKDISVFQEKSDPIDLAIKLENKQLHVKGMVGPEIEGNYHLDTKKFFAVLNMNSLSLGHYFKLAGQTDLTGNITAIIRIEGKSDNLASLTASADISSLAISWENRPLFRIAKAKASYKNKRFYLPDTQVDFEKGISLLVKGQGFLDRDLDFEASGSFPLELLSPLVKEIETAKGIVNLSASLKGSIKEPLLNADLTFNDLTLVTDLLDQEFNKISGHIRVTPQKIEILNFKGQLDQGQFDLDGHIGLENLSFKTVDLKMNTRQLSLNIPDRMDLIINSNLTLKGTNEKSALSGEIVLLEGLYYKDFNLIAAATQKTRKTEPKIQKKDNQLLDSIALNIHVTRREPLLVDNNMAFLQLNPDIILQGTVQTPVLVGRAVVDSGTVNFNKSEFKIKNGRIDFINPYKIEADMHIEGEMAIRTWIITLTVSGKPDNLEIQLFSNPSESHADIISLIAFGKTTKEMGQTQGSGLATSGQIISGLLADAFKKDLKEATGIDRLEIKMDEQTGSRSQSVKVTVGKDLSKQMGVTYGVDTSDGKTVQRVTTYYKLLENLLISGFQDSGGKIGGELKYRLEFR